MSGTAPLATREFDLPDLKATQSLAMAVAGVSQVGDVIALRGDLGCGKTAFARAFIAARGGDDDVPSPTFTLVQVYILPSGDIWHFDLYRLETPEDAVELGIDDAFRSAISLIEWPDRLGALLPAERLDVEIAFGARPDARRARLTASGAWSRRLAQVAR